MHLIDFILFFIRILFQDNNNQTNNQRELSSGNSKRKKLFGVGLDSDEEEEVGPSASGTNAIKREIERFTAENMEPSKIDVLAWWSSRMQVYPRLSKLATKYLAVLASSTPSERAMSKNGSNSEQETHEAYQPSLRYSDVPVRHSLIYSNCC